MSWISKQIGKLGSLLRLMRYAKLPSVGFQDRTGTPPPTHDDDDADDADDDDDDSDDEEEEEEDV